MTLPQPFLVIRGARVHNLKNVDLEVPHEKLTVVTGVSGSGKSSLVFDTIYAEGQRRYVESLSAYARQFLERMEKPDVDEISGIAPPVAIQQKNTTRNPRSTVGTATEIYDYLRVLFARAGETWCPQCGTRVERDTVDLVAKCFLEQPEGTRWYVLFPIQHQQGRPTDALRDRLFDLRKRGFNRLYQSGRVFEFSTPESLLEIDFGAPLYVLVDRLAGGSTPRQRVVDSIEICYREAGEVIFEQPSGEPAARLRFSEEFACKGCGRTFEEPQPRLFSFNNPFGACPRCQGFGNTIDYDMDLVIPDPSLTLAEGAVEPWQRPQYRRYQTLLARKAPGKVRMNVPYFQLREEEKAFVIKGGDTFPGVRGFFEEVESKKYKVHVRVFLSRMRGYARCPDCGGARLRPEALNVRLAGRTIAEVVRMNIAEAGGFFGSLELSPEQTVIAERVLGGARERLRFLNDVGLDYLTLDRLASTLSGGEAQRIQLATCLGSRLVGACYVLDEPSIGLHPRDTGRLIRIMEELRDLGNTILVVEHDSDIMRAADHVVDLGPGAGERGGEVVFAGPMAQLLKDGKASLTAQYLCGGRQVAPAKTVRRPDPRRILRFHGCCMHNLKNLTVEVPLGLMTAVTGVSGSGKSTLVHDVIYQSLRAILGSQGETEEDSGAEAARIRCNRVEGVDRISEVVLVDQSPIGRTPRSNPVTYLKAFDAIRQIFANTTDADRHGYTPGHFSFNIPGGRCEACQGDGTVKVEMQFLADVELICEDCKGTRYKPGILEVRYRGLNIHEVLRLTVDEAIAFFDDQPRLSQKLEVLAEVGLGYLRLGQSATTLSGGEAQRVKLAAHLANSTAECSLYIFDEPTTGLHFDDIAKLLHAFEELIRAGNSVLVIEHNLDVIRNADWIIDLGPEGGDRGGEIVATGPPDAIAAHPESYTGRHLRG